VEVSAIKINYPKSFILILIVWLLFNNNCTTHSRTHSLNIIGRWEITYCVFHIDSEDWYPSNGLNGYILFNSNSYEISYNLKLANLQNNDNEIQLLRTETGSYTINRRYYERSWHSIASMEGTITFQPYPGLTWEADYYLNNISNQTLNISNITDSGGVLYLELKK